MQKGRSVRPPAWLLLVVAVLAMPLWAPAEYIRYHGMQIDEQYHLLIEEREGGIVRIGLRYRTRPEGGLEQRYAHTEDEAETGRLEGVRYLAEVRSRVIRPTGPNYFQSRGEMYRITVRGIDEGPDYQRRQDVAASFARDALVEELRRLWIRFDGVNREALYWATPIVLSIFKEDGRMPAHVAPTVAQSLGGRLRTDDPTLTRRALPGGRQLGPDLQPIQEERSPLTGRARVEEALDDRQLGGPSPRTGGMSRRTRTGGAAEGIDALRPERRGQNGE